MSTRRGHGEGSISQRSDGRWMASVDLGYVDGKRKRKYIYGKTRKEVAEALKSLLHQQQHGVNIAPERQTVGQFLERWLADVVIPRTRPATHEIYGRSVQRITCYIGRVQLAKLSPQQVQELLRSLAADGLAPATVQRARDVLRNALNEAVKWGLVARNVAALIDPPKVERYGARVLTPAEAQQLLATATGDRLEALYRVALSLGLRRGEVLGLRWQDVDLVKGILRVAMALQRVNGELTLVPPKTTSSQRTLPLPPSLILTLRQHHMRQLQDRLLAGSRWHDHDLVFPTRIGTPISPRNLLRSFGALLQRAGLPHMRIHDLRHSCATLLAAQGVPPKVAMEILGHTDIRTTLAIYTHVLDDSKQQAISALDAILGAEAS